MIRLILDDITHKILGYENVNEYLELYHDDSLVDSVPDNILKCYYENGEFIEEERDDYHKELATLEAQLNEQEAILSDKNNKIMDALLNDTLKELKITLADAKKKKAEIEVAIRKLTDGHKKELEKFYLLQDIKNDIKIKPQYNSSVCLLIRNENQYLKEWLEHYLAIGFDHIFIYDNGNESVKEAIKDWYQENTIAKITVIDYTKSRDDLQTECYNDFIHTYSKQARWVLFADSDEFLQLPDGILVNDFLTGKEGYTEVDIDFTEYGADGQVEYEDKPVRERFTSPVTIRDGIYYKSFIQPHRIDRMQTHYPIFNQNKHKTLPRDKKAAVINHYYTKSWQEWQQKIARGSCDPNYLKHLNEFFDYNPDMVYLQTEDKVQNYNA